MKVRLATLGSRLAVDFPGSLMYWYGSDLVITNLDITQVLCLWCKIQEFYHHSIDSSETHQFLPWICLRILPTSKCLANFQDFFWFLLSQDYFLEWIEVWRRESNPNTPSCIYSFINSNCLLGLYDNHTRDSQMIISLALFSKAHNQVKEIDEYAKPHRVLSVIA